MDSNKRKRFLTINRKKEKKNKKKKKKKRKPKTHKNDDPKLWEGRKTQWKERGKELKIKMWF